MGLPRFLFKNPNPEPKQEEEEERDYNPQPTDSSQIEIISTPKEYIKAGEEIMQEELAKQEQTKKQK